MNIPEVLKGAKQYLATVKGEQGKEEYICFAIASFLETQDIKAKAKESLQKTVEDFIVTRLNELANSGHKCSAFSDVHVRAVLGVNAVNWLEYSYKKQQARHLWLDKLIKELESANTN